MAALLVAGGADAADPAGARAFVTGIYAHYPTAKRTPVFDALGKDERATFDPSMIALIREDQVLSKGEVGALDGDPLCDCQDDGGMVFGVGEVRAEGPTRATAIVARTEPSASPPTCETINLDLVRIAGRWRIHDVRTADTPSLRALLIKSNRDRRR